VCEEAGELALPGQRFLLTRMNKPVAEFVHAADVIEVSVSCDRDHLPGRVYQPAEHSTQRSDPGAGVHD
jgi:hypothetical protein